MAVTLASVTPTRDYTSNLGEKLRGRRSAPSVMQGKGIACSRVVRERRVPDDRLRFRDQVERRSRQRRQMQRLANVASRVRTIRMLVQQSATRREKKQSGACKQRQPAA
jgi:hypothetical protein